MAQAESLSDDELLDLVQEKTFNYFWDFAEPNSGMAERDHKPMPMAGNRQILSLPAAVALDWLPFRPQ